MWQTQIFGYTLYQLVWFFTIYSFLGWCCEVCFCTILTGKWVNRGFLNGPVCPIYGFGMLILLAGLTPLRHNLPLLFLGSTVLASALELATGFVLKKLFHTSWWDYSDQKFQIGGYICLKFSLLWGVGGTAVMCLLQPAVQALVGVVPAAVGQALAVPVLALFLCDAAVTVKAIAKLNQNLGEIERITQALHGATDLLAQGLGGNALAAQEKLGEAQEKLEEGQVALMERTADAGEALQKTRLELEARLDVLRADLRDHGAFGVRRLLRAFPRMRSSRYADALEAIKQKFNDLF